MGALGIAGKEALCIHQFKAIAVDRAPEEVAPVNGVAQVLQNGQFSFHEARIVTEILVAHDAVSKFDVAHEVVIYVAVFPQYLDGHALQASSQDLLDIGTDQETLVLPQIEGIRVVRGVAAIA